MNSGMRLPERICRVCSECITIFIFLLSKTCLFSVQTGHSCLVLTLCILLDFHDLPGANKKLRVWPQYDKNDIDYLIREVMDESISL